jgi:hypothetical protein
MRRCLLASAAALLLYPTARAETGSVIQLKSDPLAHYAILEARRRPDGALVVTARRDAGSGTLFMSSAFNCEDRSTRDLGLGKSLGAMRASNPGRRWRKLVPNSVAADLAAWACGSGL